MEAEETQEETLSMGGKWGSRRREKATETKALAAELVAKSSGLGLSVLSGLRRPFARQRTLEKSLYDSETQRPRL